MKPSTCLFFHLLLLRSCSHIFALRSEASPENDEDEEQDCTQHDDCTDGFEGTCDDGDCYYTALDLNAELHASELQECYEGCQGYFSSVSFFQGPSVEDGDCGEGFLCRWWQNSLMSLGYQKSDWQDLVKSLHDAEHLAVMPGLFPGAAERSELCYCKRLCEIGKAAGIGSDRSFWRQLSQEAEQEGKPYQHRLAMMEILHAGYHGEFCSDVHSFSVVGVVALLQAEADGKEFSRSLLETHHATSGNASVGYGPLLNPLRCFSFIKFFKKQGVTALSHTGRQAVKRSAKGSFMRNFMAFVLKQERRAITGLKGVTGLPKGLAASLGNFVQKFGVQAHKVSKASKAGSTFGDAMTAASIAVNVATGNVGGAAANVIGTGIQKVVGKSLLSPALGALGISGGAAIAVGVVASIGVNVVISAGVSTVMATGAGRAGLGILPALKAVCK